MSGLTGFTALPIDDTALECAKCGRVPKEIDEYVVAAADEEMTPEDYVRSEEGTLNRATGRFWCTQCYCAIGMPLGKAP